MHSGSACTLILPLDSGLTFSYHGWFILLNVRAKQFTLFPKSSEYSNPPMKNNTSSSCSSFEARPPKVFMFILGLAVGGKNHLPMSTGKPPVDITSLPLNGSLLSILFVIQIFLRSHFWRQIPIFNGQIWSLKFWRKNPWKKSSIQQAFQVGKNVPLQTSAYPVPPKKMDVTSKSLQTKLLESHLIEMCVNLGFSTKLWGCVGDWWVKNSPNRSSVWNRTQPTQVAEKTSRLEKLKLWRLKLKSNKSNPNLPTPVVDRTRGILLKVFVENEMTWNFPKDLWLLAKKSYFTKKNRMIPTSSLRSMGWGCNLYQNRGMLSISTKTTAKEENDPNQNSQENVKKNANIKDQTAAKDTGISDLSCRCQRSVSKFPSKLLAISTSRFGV